MGMGDALADVMLEGEAASANSAANWARVDAANVRSELSRAEIKAVGHQVGFCCNKHVRQSKPCWMSAKV